MEYIIRELMMEDCESIHQLNVNEMGYEITPDETKANLVKLIKSSSDKIYVAVCGTEVAGYIHVNDYDLIYAPHMKNIMGIAVAEKWQRKGIGKALLSEAEKWAKQTDAKGIRLVSGAARTEAHKFYHSCGYSGDKAQINMSKMF
ncbi:MAG: GNAT family N-acetyltransferase [Oscillospiraceae bacterium]|nr:GNAT family N-acetyltransferase [Oscillospiraceae bacterium]